MKLGATPFMDWVSWHSMVEISCYRILSTVVQFYRDFCQFSQPRVACRAFSLTWPAPMQIQGNHYSTPLPPPHSHDLETCRKQLGLFRTRQATLSLHTGVDKRAVLTGYNHFFSTFSKIALTVPLHCCKRY